MNRRNQLHMPPLHLAIQVARPVERKPEAPHWSWKVRLTYCTVVFVMAFWATWVWGG